MVRKAEMARGQGYVTTIQWEAKNYRIPKVALELLTGIRSILRWATWVVPLEAELVTI